MIETTIKAPAGFADGRSTTIKITGFAIRLPVGNKKIRFFIHRMENSEPILTHYDSGIRVCSLAGLLALNALHRVSLRDAAAIALGDIIERNGIDTVINKFNRSTKIN